MFSEPIAAHGSETHDIVDLSRAVTGPCLAGEQTRTPQREPQGLGVRPGTQDIGRFSLRDSSRSWAAGVLHPGHRHRRRNSSPRGAALTSGTLSTDSGDKDQVQQPDTKEGLSSLGHGTHTPPGPGQDTGVVVVQPAAVQQKGDAVQVIHLWREGPGHSPVDSEGCSF